MACNIEQFNMQMKHNGTVQYIKKAQVINLSNLGVVIQDCNLQSGLTGPFRRVQ